MVSLLVFGHGGHVGDVLGIRTKAFLSSGNYTLCSCKFFEKKLYCIDHQHTTNMATLSCGCKPRILQEKD